jgi:hypothetical protein
MGHFSGYFEMFPTFFRSGQFSDKKDLASLKYFLKWPNMYFILTKNISHFKNQRYIYSYTKIVFLKKL